MPEHVIATDSLAKSYDGRAAVRDLTLRVPRASVFGFLGPNGAGKSTTIRLLLGLQRPTAGRAHVLGRPAGERDSLRRVGALVEAPSVYPNLTGAENTRVTALYRGCDRAACDAALDLVGLRDAAHRRVKGYSMGMKQRLGLALALMHEPELLILDEPTNGLDPAGILEVRALIRALAQERGVTVFLSSHLLAEVGQVATHVGVLHEGSLRFQGSLEDLRASARPRLLIGASDPVGAAALLRERGFAPTTHPDDCGRLTLEAVAETDAARVNALLVGAGLAVHHLALERPSLETQFLALTGGAS